MAKQASDDTAPDGLAQVEAMMVRGLRVPIGETLGFDLVRVERRQIVVEGKPDRSVYNSLGAVHGGYAATLLDTACGIATLSTLKAGRGSTTLELKVSYLRGLREGSGTVHALGRVLSSGRRVAFAETELHDGEGRLCATATSTLLAFGVEASTREE